MTTLPTPDEVRAIMERRRRFGHDYMSRADFDAIVELALWATGEHMCDCRAVTKRLFGYKGRGEYGGPHEPRCALSVSPDYTEALSDE